MEKVKNYVILGLCFTCLILFLRGCDSIWDHNPVKPIKDTVIVHTSDTVWAKDTTYIVKWHPKQVDSMYIYDTINTHICDYIRTYKDSMSDTNLVVHSDFIVRGELLGSGLTYKLKIPIIIYDSTKTTITVINEPKIGLYGGLEGGYKSFSPYLDIRIKQYDFGASYDIYNKTPKLRVGYRIFSK